MSHFVQISGLGESYKRFKFELKKKPFFASLMKKLHVYYITTSKTFFTTIELSKLFFPPDTSNFPNGVDSLAEFAC
jgi:hypothetical protein